MSVDFIVTARRDYEGELTHLKVRALRSDEAMAPEARAKQDVVTDLLVEGQTAYTADPDGKDFVLGKEIRVVQENGNYYLRTDDEAIAEDTLEELPKF